MKRKTTLAVVAIPLILFGLLVALFAGVFDNHVRIACTIAELARPPKGAKILRSDGWSTGFSNQSCFVFQATREEIDEWIANSPGLQAVTPDILSENRKLIAFDTIDEMEQWQATHSDQILVRYLDGPRYVRTYEESPLAEEFSQIHYYITPPGGISWFTPNINNGRVFKIPTYFCSVIVDDTNNVVWVAASTS